MQYRPVRFPTGEVRATTAALANVSKEKLIRLVNRHIRGDWGDTCMADQKANEQAIRDEDRILPWCFACWSPTRFISRAGRQHKKAALSKRKEQTVEKDRTVSDHQYEYFGLQVL